MKKILYLFLLFTSVLLNAQTSSWKTLKVGAGGFITGIDIHADGTKVIRTDTYGGYLWVNGTSGGEWKQLINYSSMPSTEVGPNKLADWLYEIRIAPSNSNRFYMMFHGSVYRSDNKGATWINTTYSVSSTFSVISMPADYRGNGQKMAIDPINSDIVYVGTSDLGVWVTTNAGVTWSKINSIPVGLIEGSAYPGHSGIAFDPTSGSTGGKTNTIYIPSWGNGVWKSTDAGASWTQMSGAPTKVMHGKVASDGKYFACNQGPSYAVDNMYLCSGSTWTNISPGGEVVAFAIDPFNPARIVKIGGGGGFNQSYNRGTTWDGEVHGTGTGYNRVANDIPWLAWTNEKYMSSAAVEFDPTVPNKLYTAEGIGVWHTTFNSNWNTGTNPTMISQSKGIEQLVTNWIISPPGGKPLVGAWDRPVFRIEDPDQYPLKHGPDSLNALVAGWSFDYPSSNPNFIVGLMQWGYEQSGYSVNGGKTWYPLPSYPPLFGAGKIRGHIAVSSTTNFVWFPSNNGEPYYTLNGGVSWLPCNVPGVPTTTETGWGWAYFFNRHIVDADKVLPNTFYAYNYGPTSNAALKGIYKSTDGGATWTQSGNPPTAWPFYHAKLTAVPNKAGHLFFTAGSQGGANDPHPVTSVTFDHSIDGGVTWTSIPNVQEVITFGFGKPATVGGYPSIYIVGWVSGVYGIWRSDNEGVSWSSIGNYPLGSFDQIRTIAGDMDTYNKVYIGFGGSGFAYYSSDITTNLVDEQSNSESPFHIKLFPNPTVDGFVNIETDFAINSVIVKDISGHVILNYNSQNWVDLRGFAKGFYFVTIEGSKGQLYTEKIIK